MAIHAYSEHPNNQTMWFDSLRTLEKNTQKDIYYWEFFGDPDDRIADIKEFFYPHLEKDAIFILNHALEPWVTQWLDYNLPEQITHWTGVISDQLPDNWVYVPYWKRFIDENVGIHKTDKSGRYLYMYSWMRRHHPWRVELLDKMYEKGILRTSDIVCPHIWEDEINPGHVYGRLEDSMKYYNLAKSLIANTPVGIEKGVNGANYPEVKMRNRYYLDIVSETRVPADVGPFASEKTFRALRLGQLSVYWAQPFHVAKLREKGWKFFDNYIDHGYDTITDPDHRLSVLTDELRRLKSLHDDEWYDMWVQTYEDRVHNTKLERFQNKEFEEWMNEKTQD